MHLLVNVYGTLDFAKLDEIYQIGYLSVWKGVYGEVGG